MHTHLNFGITCPAPLDNKATYEIVKKALDEDIGEGDITSQLVIDKHAVTQMQFITREDIVACGLPILACVFETVDKTLEWHQNIQEGEHIFKGEKLFEIKGNARSILKAERVSLNILQHMCGISTLSRKYAEAVSGTGATVLDTRKTLPSLRILEKYAVKIGGCENHRMRLDDGIMIKDNHIAINGDIENAIKSAKNGKNNGLKVQVECDTLMQVEQSLKAGCDSILLDNMTTEQLKTAVNLRNEHSNNSVILEASGGIMLETIKAVAETGVDYISVGALTHSAQAADIGLDIV